jgi:hypothetical protein
MKTFIFGNRFLCAPESEKGIPNFTRSAGSEITENKRDQDQILNNQDQTQSSQLDLKNDEEMGAKTRSLDLSEEEPGDFVRGEIDVKEQMDRAADAMESSIQGYQSQGAETSPQTEMGASWKYTPGGIEEVAAKTDEYLASHGLSKKRKHTPKHHSLKPNH